jgi:hypothetical protein
MKNCIHGSKSSIIRVSVIAILLLTLFSLTSFTAFARSQNKQSTQSHTVTSLQQAVSAPAGTAAIRWSSQYKTLTVILHLSGLHSGSTHAAHIHSGTCSSMGKILYPLNNVVANTSGTGTSTTTIHNITTGIPATGWNVTAHNGATAQTGTLLCGNVTNSNTVSIPLHAVGAMRY